MTDSSVMHSDDLMGKLRERMEEVRGERAIARAIPKRIQMSRQHPWRAENPDAVIVARPSKWGNPYRIGDDSGFYDIPHDRHTAVAFFGFDFETGDGLWWEGGYRYLTVEDVRRELAGKDLACWCPLDQPCHADVLLELANVRVVALCPECRDGKHRNCTGWTLDAEDREIECECEECGA